MGNEVVEEKVHTVMVVWIHDDLKYPRGADCIEKP
jgi:hypothetical protein